VIRPPKSSVREYRAAAVWREFGSISGLRRWRDEIPQALAISAFGLSQAPFQITYHSFAALVERFSGAL
jgi:cyclohexanecarboxylate-CoA ligase